jgi:DNA-binding transcriptional MerR regulator
LVRRIHTAAHQALDVDRLASGRALERSPIADLASALIAARSRRGGSSAGGQPPRDESGGALFSDDELREVEQRHADGITAVQIVELFADRGLRFSEATFRKYVQLGLVPRSRRVGRKGKHRGSLGVYPAKAVRRINAIKRLMAEGLTIEEIQEQLLRFADLIETLEENVGELFGRLDAELAAPRFDSKVRKSLSRDVADARRTADELLRRLDDLSQKVTRPKADSYRGSGAAGSAEELL